KVCVPLTSEALEGSVALPSDELIATLSLTFERIFQFESTPFTIRLNALPAVWVLGVPVLPLADPAAAVSPGARICNLANVPGPTEINELVLAVLVPSVMSVAV